MGKRAPNPGSPRPRGRTSLLAHGEPMVWLTGGALAVALFMIVGLLVFVLVEGLSTFWPVPLAEVVTWGGKRALGEVTRTETYAPAKAAIDALPPSAARAARRAVAAGAGRVERRLYRVGNFELSGIHYEWIPDIDVKKRTFPSFGVLFERLTNGRFYGFPRAFRIDGKTAAEGAAAAWSDFLEYHEACRRRWRRQQHLKSDVIGRLDDELESARLDARGAELAHGKSSREYERAQEAYAREKTHVQARYHEIQKEIDRLQKENDRYRLVVAAASKKTEDLALEDVVRAYRPNQLGFLGRLRVYGSRWWEFLTAPPREANTEGGVYPAIVGTVVMTLIMCVLVVPFGVLAALYLKEYAKAGAAVSAVRIAINNLAGVPSIVFGVFGLGFFCYIVGAQIDQVFFRARLPNPTYGKGGLLWASLTLALLTLPVVIVATEEALAAVPGSMREGSYACGASKWQTIRRIVLPRALPGIMTGVILAMARGAGEVAPLMLVGAVKLAPKLPVDGTFPFIHPERSFMHLGFHIFDLGFESPNSEAAKPMVFTTTRLLIAIVVALNVLAIVIRARLRRRFAGGKF